MSKAVDNKAEEKAKKIPPVVKPAKNKKSFKKFFKDARSEFKKVVWPSKKSVVHNTIVVLVILAISALAIWGLDTLFLFLNKLVMGQV